MTTTTNPFFPQGDVNEQHLYEDLIIESVQIFGQNVLYLPKTIINESHLLGEQGQAAFYSALPIEMYLETFDGFGGQGNLFQKFGIEIRDQMKLIVAKRRWDTEISTGKSFPRPFEGDLVYHPLSRALFQITFVEHEIPYYQLNNLPVHKLTLELFEYNGERFETGIPEVDSFELLYGSGGITLDVEMKVVINDSLSSSPPFFDHTEYLVPGESYNSSLLKFYSVLNKEEEEPISIETRIIDDDNDASPIIEESFVIMKVDFGQISPDTSRTIKEGDILVGDETGIELKVIKVYDLSNSENDQDYFSKDSEADNVTIEHDAKDNLDEDNNEDNPFGFV